MALLTVVVKVTSPVAEMAAEDTDLAGYMSAAPAASARGHNAVSFEEHEKPLQSMLVERNAASTGEEGEGEDTL